MAFRALGKRMACLHPRRNAMASSMSCGGKRSITTSDPQNQAQDKQQGDSVQVPLSSKQDDNRSWALANRRPRSLMPGLFSPFFGQSTSLTQMMDAMDRFFSSPTLMDPTRRFGDLLGDNRMPWDVMEDEKSIKLRVDMPGYSKDEVKLSVEDDELVLKADHQTSKEEDDWSTQTYGSYNLRIRLPENVDPASIKAELKDGVLKVKVPKVEASKKESHTVQVE